MESEAVRRRMNMIAAHFASSDDISPTHLIPMNCSGSLNSVIPRCDNRMYFARQGSATQAFFMRQQGSSLLEKPGVPNNCSVAEAPLFSRPTRIEPYNFSNQEPIQFPHKDCNLPQFARPTPPIPRKKQSSSKKNVYSSQPNGSGWSPRMDVAESGRSYIIRLEIPGVTANDIRVEVTETSLRIKGKRSTQWWRAGGWSRESISAYHKREILEGPYEVVWPLPSDVNKDTISAEFLSGFLQIIIPKL